MHGGHETGVTRSEGSGGSLGLLAEGKGLLGLIESAALVRAVSPGPSGCASAGGAGGCPCASAQAQA